MALSVVNKWTVGFLFMRMFAMMLDSSFNNVTFVLLGLTQWAVADINLLVTAFVLVLWLTLKTGPETDMGPLSENGRSPFQCSPRLAMLVASQIVQCCASSAMHVTGNQQGYDILVKHKIQVTDSMVAIVLIYLLPRMAGGDARPPVSTNHVLSTVAIIFGCGLAWMHRTIIFSVFDIAMMALIVASNSTKVYLFHKLSNESHTNLNSLVLAVTGIAGCIMFPVSLLSQIKIYPDSFATIEFQCFLFLVGLVLTSFPLTFSQFWLNKNVSLELYSMTLMVTSLVGSVGNVVTAIDSATTTVFAGQLIASFGFAVYWNARHVQSMLVRSCKRSTILKTTGLLFLLCVPVFIIIINNLFFVDHEVYDHVEDLHDHHIKNWHATDPRLIKHIRKHYLQPPSTGSYNLDNPEKEDWSQKRESTHAVKLLRNKRNGFFVESGGYDGETWSNSLMLEKYYNFSGLLVEPDAKNLEVMRSKNRKSWIASACINGGEYPTKMKMIGAKELGALQKYIPSTRMFYNRLWRPVKVSLVWCFPLGSLLRAVNRTSVDYITLDMEGAELDVLKGLVKDTEISVNVVQVEFQVYSAPFFDTKKSEIRQNAIKEIFQKHFPDMSYKGAYYYDLFFINNTQNV